MMNAEEYQNTLPYPWKESFTTTYYYKAGKVIAIKKDGNLLTPDNKLVTDDTAKALLLRRAAAEKVVDEQAHCAAINAYQAENARLIEKFKRDLFEELGISDHPKREKLYSLAWELGHSTGFSEVVSYAEQLSELLD